jgi:hypothetical protein
MKKNSTSNSDIVMQLNAESSMQMTASRPVDELCLCDSAALILRHPALDHFEITPWSRTNTIFDILTSLRFRFEYALQGKLVLPILPHNIGYLQCEKFHLPPQARSKIHETIGVYLLVDTPAPTSTWLYERDGNFFMEIAPAYPWEFDEPKPDEQYYTYEDFMASYESILTIPIEHLTIEKLYSQVAQLADEILAREYALHSATQESNEN